MAVFYENVADRFYVREFQTRNFPAHLHEDFEVRYIEEGEMTLNIGSKSYVMHKGEFALIFPELIHSIEVPEGAHTRSIVLVANPTYAGTHLQTLKMYLPKNPILPASKVHEDIPYALRRLLQSRQSARRKSKNRPAEGTPEAERMQRAEAQAHEIRTMLRQAFVQVIFARALPCYEMELRQSTGSVVAGLSDAVTQAAGSSTGTDSSSAAQQEQNVDGGILFETVRFISQHSKENITLEDVATGIGYSMFAVSRVFSEKLGMNFNQYLNHIRLNDAMVQLRYSDEPITDICYEAGFSSVRTFNRAFQEQYGMSPRQYRKLAAAGSINSEVQPLVEPEKR